MMIRAITLATALGCSAPASIAYAQTIEQLNKAAIHYANQGKYREAIFLFEMSLSQQPQAQTYYDLGICHLNSNSLDNAHKAFERAVAMDRSYVTGYHLLGARYYSAASYPDDFNPPKAQEILEKALAIDPNHAGSQFRLSQMYFIKATMNTSQTEMKEYQKLAEKALLRAIELDPKEAEAHSMLGQLYGTHGKKNSAVLHFQKAVKLNPQHDEAWFYLGMDYYTLGLIKESVDALEKAQGSRKPEIREAAAKLLVRARAALAARR